MAKTKGGRSVNPTDAFRKEERRKQVNRNKLERKFQREAHRKINNASSLKAELNSIIDAEQSGTINKTMRLKKKVLKDAYDHALRRQRESEIRTQALREDVDEPEDTSNGNVDNGSMEGLSTVQIDVPVPPPPPLPFGAPPRHAERVSDHVLPPPVGVYPGYALPPPPGPPPRMFPVHPPQQPMYSPHMTQGMPLPSSIPRNLSVRKSTADVVKDHRPTITAPSTVVKKPLAQNDRTVTAMVPTSVRITRQSAQQTGCSVRKPNLAPDSKTEASTVDNGQSSMEQKMAAFLSEVEELGAFDA